MAEDYPEVERQGMDNLAVGARGGAIAFLLRVSGTALGFINSIILARILGAGGIGEVILTLTVVEIFALFAQFGMQGAMMRFIPSYIEKKEIAKLRGVIHFVLLFCLVLSIVLSALILLLSRFISINIFHTENLLKLLPVASIILPVSALGSVIGAILKGYKDAFRSLLPQLFISPVFKILIFLFLSLRGALPLYAIVAALSGEIFAMLLYIVFLLKKMDKVSPEYERREYRKVLGIASTMIFTNFSWFLYAKADLWVVGMFASSESVGVYGVVSRLVTLIAFPLGAFATIIPSIMSAVYTSGDNEELRRVVRESTRWILSMSIPVILFLILEGKFILGYAFGEKFVSGYTAMTILCIGQLINVGSGLVAWLLQMTGGHKTFLKISLFWGILNVILNLILVPRFGIIGAAISTAFCLSMMNIVSVWMIYNRLSVLTLAKGLKFDVLFAGVVALIYFLFRYNDFYMGQHLLLIAALIVYVWRSIVNGDLPWRHILGKI